jgi:CRISPR-associated protein Csm1
MSIQVFLQGKLLGVRGFLSAQQPGLEPAAQERLLAGKSSWVSLLTEILPRALLAEFGLSKILLGSSGGGQFLLVLPKESETQADAFLTTAAAGIDRLSQGKLKLVWASTENLGDWTVVRRRLREAMATRRATLAQAGDPSWFAPFDPAAQEADDRYFLDTLGNGLVEQRVVGWSPEHPERILLNEGKYTWTLGPDHDQILLTRHVALSDDGKSPVTAAELGRRADGTSAWGVLRGDVDNLDIRFRRLVSIEEHVQLSVLYKQFFAGELEVLCSMPEFWRKVTILYSGGDDFAAYGSWDALIALARELQRLFRRFSDESLKDFPGGEGKTITMALTLADHADASLQSVLRESDRMLEEAKSISRDCFALLGRVLEWRQVNGASELKDTMVRVAQEFGGSTQFLRELASFYREEVFAPVSTPRRREGELEKPWRLHRRVLRVLPPTRDRELEKLRSSLMVELVGKNASQVKLRPAGRVALEWARLVTQG